MKGPDRRRRETVGPLPVAEHVTWKPGARDTPNVCIRDMGLFVCEPPQPMAAYLRSPAEKNEAPGIRALFVFFALTGLDGWVLTRRARRRTLQGQVFERERYVQNEYGSDVLITPSLHFPAPILYEGTGSLHSA